MLDLQHAAQALAGDADLLRRVLQSFLEQFAPLPLQLTQALQLRQFDVAVRLVHTIKGLAPTLGADVLHQVAQRFELALKQHDAALLATFCQALDEVLSAIGRAAELGRAAPAGASAGGGER